MTLDSTASITVLHVSDMQFGRHHRFGNLAMGDPDARLDTLYTRLTDDLVELDRAGDLRPQVIVASGDLAEWGLRTELSDAFEFLGMLAEQLRVPRRRVIVVPGNHDVNLKLCESYFNECEAEEREPLPPYARKWEPFRAHFDAFYGDVDGVSFTPERPWSFWELSELKLVVAGLNSTMRESHRREDHYGWVGEAQARWFAERLEPYVQRHWFRLAVVHHNIQRGVVADDENLMDSAELTERLGDSVNLILHGHTHDARVSWLDPSRPVLSTGSAALSKTARPEQVPNQYQVIRVSERSMTRWARRYESSMKRWAGDTRSSASRRDWKVTDEVPFRDVGATFKQGDASAPGHRPDEARWRDEHAAAHEDTSHRHDFLARVAEIGRLRHGGDRKRVEIEEFRQDARHPYLSVRVADGDIVSTYPIGVAENGVTTEIVRGFRDEVFERYYWALDPNVRCELVYGGRERAPDELFTSAGATNVKIRSFVEFQGIIDLRGYVKRQTGRLQADAVYPPEHYIAQQLEHEVGTERRVSEDAVEQIIAWLREPRGRFALVLGDFGAGKTFLLRELVRRMPAALPHLTPVLLELRALEKAHTLEQLIAQHMAAAGEEYIDLKALPYMLREGRIALLVDGFDELALRVTYHRAAEHFETLMQAAGGDAKVVVTSRTQHFENDQQIKTALFERAEQLAGLTLGRILPFDEQQIMAFLRRRLDDPQKAAERFELIAEIRDLLGLSHNPRMLSFIVGIPDEQLRAARTRPGTITSAGLYRLLIERWLKYEYERVQPPGAAPLLSLEQRWEAVTTLALCLWEKLDRTIRLSELTEQVASAVERLSPPAQQSGLAEPTDGAQLDRDTIAHLVGSGTLLVRDDDGAFAFVHQSVMEWLVANRAAAQLREGAKPDALERRGMTSLMADFFCDLAGPDRARAWAQDAVAARERSVAPASALLVLKRLGGQVDRPSLSGSSLSGDDLSGTNMAKADLKRADLTDVRMARADLGNADLTGATLVRADLTSANLSGATLDGADARGTRLLGADLRGASFAGASVRRAKLTGARLDSEALLSCDTFGAALPNAAAPQPMLSSAISDCNGVAVHPAGDLVASAHRDGSVRLWDPQTATELRILRGHRGAARAVAFSPDGRLLATTGDDATLRIWDPGTATELGVRSGHLGAAWAVAFSSDSATIASAHAGGAVHLWNPRDVTQLRLDGHPTSARAVAFSPDGDIVASGGDDDAIRLWDSHTATSLGTLGGHETSVRALAYSPDGTLLASAGTDGTIRLWDPRRGLARGTLTGHDDWVLAVAYSPDGNMLVSAGEDGTVRLWDPHGVAPRRVLRGHRDWVRAVAFSPDGATLASAGDDGAVRIWDPRGATELRTLSGHRSVVRAVAFSPDGSTLASAHANGHVRLWDPTIAAEPRILSGHLDGVRAVAFSPDGQTLAAADGVGGVRLWDPQSTTDLRTLDSRQGVVHAVAFSPAGDLLASAHAGGDVQLWDPRTERKLRTLSGHQDWVRTVGFSSDGKMLASAGGDGTVRVWDVAHNTTLRVLSGHQGVVRAAAFSPDGTILTSAGDDGSLRFWDPRADVPPRIANGQHGGVLAVAFAPDGATLATAHGDGSLRVWDPERATELLTLEGHQDRVRAVTYSPDGTRLASAGRDGSVRLWNPATGRLLVTLICGPNGWAGFTPDGRYKLSGRIGNAFWFAIALCRFTPGELDAFLPAGTLRRLAPGEPL